MAKNPPQLFICYYISDDRQRYIKVGMFGTNSILYNIVFAATLDVHNCQNTPRFSQNWIFHAMFSFFLLYNICSRSKYSLFLSLHFVLPSSPLNLSDGNFSFLQRFAHLYISLELEAMQGFLSNLQLGRNKIIKGTHNHELLWQFCFWFLPDHL